MQGNLLIPMGAVSGLPCRFTHGRCSCWETGNSALMIVLEAGAAVLGLGIAEPHDDQLRGYGGRCVAMERSMAAVSKLPPEIFLFNSQVEFSGERPGSFAEGGGTIGVVAERCDTRWRSVNTA